jgi:hypothetical protein
MLNVQLYHYSHSCVPFLNWSLFIFHSLTHGQLGNFLVLLSKHCCKNVFCMSILVLPHKTFSAAHLSAAVLICTQACAHTWCPTVSISLCCKLGRGKLYWGCTATQSWDTPTLKWRWNEKVLHSYNRLHFPAYCGSWKSFLCLWNLCVLIARLSLLPICVLGYLPFF